MHMTSVMINRMPSRTYKMLVRISKSGGLFLF